MNKKQRDRKNRKRAVKVGELKMKDRTIRYVDVQFLMKVGGKVYGQKRFHYRRGRETSASDLEQLASIITMWEKAVNFGSTNAYEFLHDVEGRIENRSGLTADQIFVKHWVHFRETIDEEFERKNKGVPGELWCEHHNDYLRTVTALSLDAFSRAPMVVKLARIYGLFRLCYGQGGFDELRHGIETMPQYIRDIVDGLFVENEPEKEGLPDE